MSLPVVTHPNLSLKLRSKPLETAALLSKETQKFIDDMIDTMYADDGVGLAAPQVGKHSCICIIGKDTITKSFQLHGEFYHKKKDLILINPSWEKLRKKTATDVEGCLSVPKIYGTVSRNKHITVKALDRNGNPISFTADNFFARVIQHEVDHLHGVLFIEKAKNLHTIENNRMVPIVL